MALAAILGTALLGACARAPVVARPVVSLPPGPALPVCPDRPAAPGVVVQREEDGPLFVMFPLEVLEQLSAWIPAERACRAEREALLEGHVEKLENRLRALGAP